MPAHNTQLYLTIAGLEVEYPATIHFGYSPGAPAYTPPGEYGPIDPPEPPEVQIERVEIWDKDGKTLECPSWLFNQISVNDDVFVELCDAGEDARQPDPDEAYEARLEDERTRKDWGD